MPERRTISFFLLVLRHLQNPSRTAIWSQAHRGICPPLPLSHLPSSLFYPGCLSLWSTMHDSDHCQQAMTKSTCRLWPRPAEQMLNPEPCCSFWENKLHQCLPRSLPTRRKSALFCGCASIHRTSRHSTEGETAQKSTFSVSQGGRCSERSQQCKALGLVKETQKTSQGHGLLGK